MGTVAVLLCVLVLVVLVRLALLLVAVVRVVAALTPALLAPDWRAPLSVSGYNGISQQRPRGRKMAIPEFIDRNLRAVNFTATVNDTKHWIECYLNESEFSSKRYNVVERININSRGGNNDFTLFTTDDLAEAEAKYAEVERRVKAAIADALR